MCSTWWVVSLTASAGTSLSFVATCARSAERAEAWTGPNTDEASDSAYACHTAWVNGSTATRAARMRLHQMITARRSIRSATTPAKGPIVNHGMERRAIARPTAVTVPDSWCT